MHNECSAFTCFRLSPLIHLHLRQDRSKLHFILHSSIPCQPKPLAPAPHHRKAPTCLSSGCSGAWAPRSGLACTSPPPMSCTHTTAGAGSSAILTASVSCTVCVRGLGVLGPALGDLKHWHRCHPLCPHSHLQTCTPTFTHSHTHLIFTHTLHTQPSACWALPCVTWSAGRKSASPHHLQTDLDRQQPPALRARRRGHR